MSIDAHATNGDSRQTLQLIRNSMTTVCGMNLCGSSKRLLGIDRLVGRFRDITVEAPQNHPTVGWTSRGNDTVKCVVVSFKRQCASKAAKIRL